VQLAIGIPDVHDISEPGPVAGLLEHAATTTAHAKSVLRMRRILNEFSARRATDVHDARMLTIRYHKWLIRRRLLGPQST
jgi:hypothetical protein